MADEHPLFLGVPDAAIDEQVDRQCSWDTNKFGGFPNWMHNPDVFPSCPECNKRLHLVAQIYCPLDHSQYHRTLYIFGCVNPLCWNNSKSWLVLRSQVLSNNEKQYDTQDKEVPEKLGSVDDWCDDAEDWGDGEDSSETAITELESQTSKLTLNPNKDTAEKQPQAFTKVPLPSHCTLPYFTPFYINVFEDTTNYKQSSRMNLTSHEKDLLQQYQQKEGKELKDIFSTTMNTKGQSAENYERANISHGDYGFHKFLKCVQSCPGQCIRYQWDGMPLLISNKTPLDVMSAVPPCQYCGAHRVYELQLMPALVPLLKIKDHKIESPSDIESPSNIETPSNIESPSNIGSPSNIDTPSSINTPSNISKAVNRNPLFGENNSGCLSNNASSPYMGENSGSLLVDKNNETTDSTPYMDTNSQFSLAADNNRATPYMDKNNQFSLAADNNRKTKDTNTQSSLAEKDDHIWEKASTNEQGPVISESPSQGCMDARQFKYTMYDGEKGRIEFGTVIVFSCSQSCWESEGSSIRQEFVVVQADPDEDLFNKKLGNY